METEPASENKLFDQGVKAFEAGDFDQALAISEQLLEKASDDAMAWWLKGTTLVSRQEYRAAVQALGKAVAFNPELASAWFQKGLSHHHLGDLEAAVEAYTRASTLQPENAQYQRRLGQAKALIGDFAGAVAPLQRALELNPDFVSDDESLAMLCSAFNETARPREALAALDAARKQEPKPPETAQLWFQEGLARNLLQDYHGALKALDRAAEAFDDPAQIGLASLHQALAHQGLQDHSRAMVFFDKALELMPKGTGRSFLLLHSAKSQAALGNRAAAEQAVAEAARRPVQQWDFFFLKGILLAGFGHFADAVRDMDKAIALVPEAALQSTLLLSKANFLRLKGDLEAAVKILQDVDGRDSGADGDPARTLTYFLVKGGVLNGLGRAGEALEALQQAVSLDPESADAWAEMALSHLRLKQYQQALMALDRAIATTEGSARTKHQFSKALVLKQKGDFEAALEVLEAVAASDEAMASDLQFIDAKVTVLLTLGRHEEVEALFAGYAGKDIGVDPMFQSLWAIVLMAIGKFQQSAEKLEAIAGSSPDDDNAQHWLAAAVACSTLGRFPDALEALGHVRQLDPALEHHPFYLNSRAISMSSVGCYEEARIAALELIERDPIDATARVVLAGALAGLGRHEEALAVLDEAMALSLSGNLGVTQRIAALLQKGWIMAGREQPKEALDQFLEAARLAEEAASLPNLIVALTGEGLTLFVRARREKGERASTSREEALQAVSRAAELSQKLPAGLVPGLAWWTKGNILAWLERDEEALVSFQRAVEHQPRMAHMRLSLGEAYERLQNYEKAVEVYTDASELAIQAEMKYDAWLGRGRALLRLERFEEAVEAVRLAIAQNGETERTAELLGRAYNALGRHEAALRTFRRGWATGRQNRRSPSLALGVSAVLLGQGREAEAKAFLDKAEQQTKFDGRLHYNRGVALYGLKKRRAAAAAFRKAAELGVPNAAGHAAELEGAGTKTGSWLEFWFGRAPWIHRLVGGTLVLLLLLSVTPAVLSEQALNTLWWLRTSNDWKLVVIPVVLFATLLALPNLKRVSVGDLELEVSQPEPHAERPDLASTLKAFMEASPTTGAISAMQKPGAVQ